MKIEEIKHIGIIGLGLIGGSLAKAVRLTHPEICLTGMDANPETSKLAVEQRIIDQSVETLAEITEQVDVLILCTPVQTTQGILEELSHLPISKDLLVTDAASTKQEVVAAAEKLTQKQIHFVAGHPMAGSHKSGILAADENLFENAFYILIPTKKSQKEDIELLRRLLKGTRAKFIELTAQEHDQVTGMLSHFPHVTAAVLVNQAVDFLASFPQGRQLAAGGFRDITRIASSDPQMWTDIVMTNPEPLVDQVNQSIQRLEEIKQWVVSKNQTAIFQFFAQAKYNRDTLPIHERGAILNFYDLFVQVPDYPGVIAEVTNRLAQDELSVTNIRIIENREDLYGVLQLTFKTKQEMEVAAQIIDHDLGYECRQKL